MKYVLFFSVSLLTLSCTNAQNHANGDVPKNVKAAFLVKYPTVKNVKWEKEAAGYEAEFKMNKIEMSATFSNEGLFQEVEEEINASTLPKVVNAYCIKNYPDHKLSEAAKITDASGKITYEAEMAKGKEHFDVIFDANGGFVEKK